MDESGEPAKPQIPTPQPQPTTFESKPHINSWFIWLGVVLAAVVGSFLLTYFVLLPRTASRIPVSTPQTTVVPSPTPPPAGGSTANWKTFSNSYSNWEIKYPSDWEVSAVGCGNASADQCDNVIIRGTNVFHGQCLDPKIRCGTFHIESRPLPPETIPAEATMSAKEYVKSTGNPNVITLEPSEEILVNGEVGYQQTVQNAPGNTAITRSITLLHKQKRYTLSFDEGYYQDKYNIHKTSDWKLLNTFNVMLSTFKFL